MHLLNDDLISKLFAIDCKLPESLSHLEGKTVCVTGAGGFIGHHLCMALGKYSLQCLLLVESSEFALYESHRKLVIAYPNLKIVPVLSDCGDEDTMHSMFSAFKTDVLYHVAAYKHVPLVERNPLAGVRNNVFASASLFEVARLCGVKSLVVVSTDKAVNPTNVMGATKRLVEMCALSMKNQFDKVKVVRFGNVLGSTGSVLPLFYEQLKQGFVTITDVEVDRYLMSAKQAVSLILECSTFNSGIYVFKMGKPVKILELAQNMANLLGVKEYKVKVVGLRPGEKLHEELTLGLGLQSTPHPSIDRANEWIPSLKQMHKVIQALKTLVSKGDVQQVLKYLTLTVPGYEAPYGVVSDVHLQSEIVKADCFATPSPDRY